jgi:hypothetical protein
MFQVVVWPGRVGSDDFLLRERKAVPGADALVPDFEKIALKTASTVRRAKGGGCDCSRPRLNRPVKITGKTAGNPLP